MNVIMLSNQVFKIKMGSKYAPKILELLLLNYLPKGFSFWGTSSLRPHTTTMFYISAKLNNFISVFNFDFFMNVGNWTWYRTMHVVIYFKCLPQLCTKINRFKFDFSKNFWGGAHLSPLPRPLPPFFLGLRPRFRLHPQLSGASRSIRASPSTFDWRTWFDPQNKFLDPPLIGSTAPPPPLKFLPTSLGSLQIHQNLNTSHQYSKNYIGFQSNNASIINYVFLRTKHFKFNNLPICTIVSLFLLTLCLQDHLIHRFCSSHMSVHLCKAYFKGVVGKFCVIPNLYVQFQMTECAAGYLLVYNNFLTI